MPHQVPNRRSLVNYGTCYLQHPLGVPQSPSSSIDEAPFRVLGGSRFRASSVGRCGFDFLKCQTFAASPAEPGELLFWFSALLAAALWVLLGIVSRSYLLLLAGVVAMQCMLVIGSTVLGGFLVERGKLLRAEGRLVSCRMFVEQACVLIAGPLAGYLAGLPFDTAALIGAAIAVVVAPIAAVCVTEPVQEKSALVGAKYVLSDLRSMLNSRGIWLVAIFSLVSSIPHSFGTHFYQKNTLAFSRLPIGVTATMAFSSQSVMTLGRAGAAAPTMLVATARI